MPNKIEKLIAYPPGSAPLEFDGQDVDRFGHDPETGHLIFSIKPFDPDRVADGPRHLPDTMDFYHGIPFMIRQQKDVLRVHLPNPSDARIIKP